jgi:hypothetical protein
LNPEGALNVPATAGRLDAPTCRFGRPGLRPLVPGLYFVRLARERIKHIVACRGTFPLACDQVIARGDSIFFRPDFYRSTILPARWLFAVRECVTVALDVRIRGDDRFRWLGARARASDRIDEGDF